MKQATKVYSLSDVIFYCLDSYEVKKDENGNVIEKRSIEGFPTLEKIGNCVPELKGRSPQEILAFFEEHGNDFLYEEEGARFMPIYSVLGIRYAPFGRCSPEEEIYANLEGIYPVMGPGLAGLAKGIDRFAQGNKLLHLSKTNPDQEIIHAGSDGVVITLKKYCSLGRPRKLILDGGEVRPYSK